MMHMCDLNKLNHVWVVQGSNRTEIQSSSKMYKCCMKIFQKIAVLSYHQTNFIDYIDLDVFQKFVVK